MFTSIKVVALAAATTLTAAQLMAGTAFAAASLNDNGANINGVTQSNRTDNGNPQNDNNQGQPSNPGNPDNNDKNHETVRICHATHADVNPYNSIEVDRDAVDGIAGNSGNQADHYGEHQGPLFDATKDKKDQPVWGDIIPALIGGHNGLNWTAAGQAIWNNDCNVPQSSDDTPGNDQQNPSVDKVTLCHATGSDTNPFEVITIDVAGAYNGHMGHQDNRDIIPPFVYQGTQYSLNWTAAGQAAWNNNCVPANGMGSGPTTPVDPADPSTPVAPTTAGQLANTGLGIWISSLVSIMIIGMSALLGILTRRKLTTN